MTDSIITRATRALAKSQCGVDDLDGLDEEMQAKLREDVRAVLEAIREPTQAMLDAGEYDDNGAPGEGVWFGGSQLADSWDRMIDAALSE